VLFVKNRHFEKSATNFAKATAGLPEYSWFYSLKKCLLLKDLSLSDKNLNVQIFELLKSIIRTLKRVSLDKIAEKLRTRLLEDDFAMLKGYVEPHWAWMKRALMECKGRSYDRADLPYEIMGRFLTHKERTQNSLEIALAKKERLTL